MGRKAKHHYIPKCYLKGFTKGGTDDSPFWCVPVDNNEPFITNPNNSCAQRDYYTVQHPNSLVVKDFYAKEIEPKISIALTYINDHSSLPPREEMRFLILLLATLYVRTPSFRKTLEAPMRRTKEIIDSISEDILISNRKEFEYTQTDIIKVELDLIDTAQECLANKYYQLHIIDEPGTFVITSDCPFVMSHPNADEGFYFGLNTSNIEICVPVTKKSILIVRNEPFEEGFFSAKKELVGLTNTKLILSTNKFFYSCNDEFLLVDDDIRVHNHILKRHRSR